jgi:hypothetical protein
MVSFELGCAAGFGWQWMILTLALILALLGATAA